MRFASFIAALFMGLSLLSCGPRSSSASTIPSPEILRNLSGNYSMKMVVDGDVRYSTAVVSEIAVGQFQIARITVYGPVRYGFTLGQNAAVSSQELGNGQVTYQQHIKKTTIHFEKSGSVCELTR